MTKLAVAVKMDADGNVTVDFDKEALLRPTLKTLMREVAASLPKERGGAPSPEPDAADANTAGDGTP